MNAAAFYDDLAELYHLIYADWELSIHRQGEVLNELIVEALGEGSWSVLDVSCGIGTQALGLAARGHAVTASDLAPGAVARACREAETRGLAVSFSVADMRACDRQHPGRTFDVVLSADNSVPHLLTERDIEDAFSAFHRCARPGGLVIVSVRDYEREDRSSPRVVPYGLRAIEGGRCLIWQVWDWHGAHYDLAMYFVLDQGTAGCRTVVTRSRYHAVGLTRLAELLRQAGFVEVRRVDGRFFQPVLIGRRQEKSVQPGDWPASTEREGRSEDSSWPTDSSSH
jgi:SAM-dependent methyltransferase